MIFLVFLHFFNRLLRIILLFIPALRNIDFIADLNNKELCLKLARKGVTLGANSVVYDTIFSSSAKGDEFIIGSNCTVTGATLLGHDASPSIFIESLINKPKPWRAGARSSYRNKITIGDNVFVGCGVIILPGVTLGSNIVVAAGSVVTKSFESNVVIAGNPARVINSIDNYKFKYMKLLDEKPDHF